MTHHLEINLVGSDSPVMRCLECGAQWVDPTKDQIAKARAEYCSGAWQPEFEFVEVTTIGDAESVFVEVRRK